MLQCSIRESQPFPQVAAPVDHMWRHWPLVGAAPKTYASTLAIRDGRHGGDIHFQGVDEARFGRTWA